MIDSKSYVMMTLGPCSADNLFGGLTSYSRMHYHSDMISSDCNRLFPVFRFCLWAAEPLRETLLMLIASSLRKNFVSNH